MAGSAPALSVKVGRHGSLYLFGFARAEINGEDKERFQVRRIMADARQRSDIDPSVGRGLVSESWPKLENVSRQVSLGRLRLITVFRFQTYFEGLAAECIRPRCRKSDFAFTISR